MSTVLPDTGTTEKTNLSASSVRREKVDDLDTSLKNFRCGGLVDERGRIGVDRGKLHTFDLASLVDRLTDDVHDTPDPSAY